VSLLLPLTFTEICANSASLRSSMFAFTDCPLEYEFWLDEVHVSYFSKIDHTICHTWDTSFALEGYC